MRNNRQIILYSGNLGDEIGALSPLQPAFSDSNLWIICALSGPTLNQSQPLYVLYQVRPSTKGSTTQPSSTILCCLLFRG